MRNKSAALAFLGLIALASGAVAQHNPINDRHWRRRAHVPPLPYPEYLHQNPLDRIPRLHTNPHATSPPTPYPQALHPLPVMPLSGGFTMTASHDVGAPGAAPSGTISSARAVADYLAACWTPPDDGDSSPEVSLRLSFSRSGAVLGGPRVTYIKAGEGDSAGERVRASILAAVGGCAPLPFTADLGSAIAGQPFAIRFVALRHVPASPSTD